MKDPRIEVWCDRTEDYVPARLSGGKYFCANCGATDHEEAP